MVSRLNQFVDKVRKEISIPDIVGERCVHTRVESAQCKACVDACPRDAWILDDDVLGLAEEACDGCGLCAPACPQGAIRDNLDVAVRQWQRRPLAMVACDQAETTVEQGVVSCVHSIGLQDILSLYRKGISYWGLVTGNCDQCPRGSAVRMDTRLEQLNIALAHSGHTKIDWDYWPKATWADLVQKTAPSVTEPSFNRRNFLRGFASAGVAQAASAVGLNRDESSGYISAGQLLPESDNDRIWPVFPVIDVNRCNGCDACTKLCPQRVFELELLETSSCYTIDPSRCSGCRICIDICDQEAVSLHQWALQQQSQITMRNAICSSCGVSFHTPALKHSSRKILCRICTQNDYQKNLFQIQS